MSVYEKLVRGLNEAIEFEKGTLSLRTNTVAVLELDDFSADDIKEIRKKTKLSQALFAKALGVKKKTVEAWESGKNIPSDMAKRFLAIIAEDPDFFAKNGIVDVQEPHEEVIQTSCTDMESEETSQFVVIAYSPHCYSVPKVSFVPNGV